MPMNYWHPFYLQKVQFVANELEFAILLCKLGKIKPCYHYRCILLVLMQFLETHPLPMFILRYPRNCTIIKLIWSYSFLGSERNPSPAQSVGNLNFKSFKRKPLLFLTPSVNLGQSVSVDTNLPLENQE